MIEPCKEQQYCNVLAMNCYFSIYYSEYILSLLHVKRKCVATNDIFEACILIKMLASVLIMYLLL